MPDDSALEAVIDTLERYRVRATYGAVAAHLGRNATFLMDAFPRTPRYSWVVNQDCEQPTNYTASEKHPELTMNSLVLKDVRALRDWLARKARQESRRSRNTTVDDSGGVDG